MKVVVLTNILTPYRLPLFKALSEQLDELVVVTMAESHEDRAWELKGHSFKTVLLPGFHLRPGGHVISIHLNFGVFSTLKSLGPDVVISGGYGLANISAFLYCKMFSVKHVSWGELVLQDGSENSLIRRFLRRLIIKNSDGCIASSTVSKSAFLHYGARENSTIVTIMPIDVFAFSRGVKGFKCTPEYEQMKSRYSGPVLLLVSRLIPVKGIDNFFDIYRILLKSHAEATVLIVGDGPERDSYERKCKDNGWKNVHFVGFVQEQELYKYYAISDLFIFPTLNDPFGAVLSEAMSAQLLSISSVYAAATYDLVLEGETGYIIDPYNAEDSCGKILTALALPSKEKEKILANAFQRVKNSDFPEIAEDMSVFCSKLV